MQQKYVGNVGKELIGLREIKTVASVLFKSSEDGSRSILMCEALNVCQGRTDLPKKAGQ